MVSFWFSKRLEAPRFTQAGSIFRNEPYPTKKIRISEIECIEIQMDAHVMLGRERGAATGVAHWMLCCNMVRIL